MDKRIEKTKKALRSAFFQLRAKKPVRCIKIAELCQLADVNKTTFYAHYEDIYALAEDVEKRLLYKIISSIPRDTEYTFSNPANFTKEVTLAFERNMDEMTVLFGDGDLGRLGIHMEQVIKNTIFARHPHLRSNGEMNVLLSYCIHGALHARMSNPGLPSKTILATLEKITSALGPVMEGSQPATLQ